MRAPALLLAISILGAVRQASADQTFDLFGQVAAGAPDHVYIDFDVPAGVAEIEIDHRSLSSADTIDWGLYDPSGFRGWGGGNTEPIVISEDAASRSYLAGPIAAGTWRLVVGKARFDGEGAAYQATVTLRDRATLEPQPERQPYVDAGAVSSGGPRWYAGDFHVHSIESGDARPPIDEIVAYAKGKKLDFVELSDHNTTSQLDFMVDAQSRAGSLLLLPGVEYTTYAGHANGIGATAFVDHKIGQPGVTIDGAVDQFHEMGALFALNHPTLDLGNVCIGCAWKHDLAPEKIDALEVATAGSASVFIDATLKLWESLCDGGHHIAAIGGSDDHGAGVDVGMFGAPIGSPATMVYADELSTKGIIDAIRAGRTVVKVRGPDDPMVEITKEAGGRHAISLVARVTGGNGMQARWVSNGENGPFIPLDSDDQTIEIDVIPPPEGSENRYRVEVWEGTSPVTFTSHVWIDASQGGFSVAGGESCEVRAAQSPRSSTWFAAALLGAAFSAIALRSTRVRGPSR